MAGKQASGTGQLLDIKVTQVNKETVIDAKLRLRYDSKGLVQLGEMVNHSVDVKIEGSQEEIEFGTAE